MMMSPSCEIMFQQVKHGCVKILYNINRLSGEVIEYLVLMQSFYIGTYRDFMNIINVNTANAAGRFFSHMDWK